MARDKKRLCVVFWSLGNETGYGENLREAAKLIKQQDDTRLVHYESTHKLDDTKDDVLDLSCSAETSNKVELLPRFGIRLPQLTGKMRIEAFLV